MQTSGASRREIAKSRLKLSLLFANWCACEALLDLAHKNAPVMPGLDPGIHQSSSKVFPKKMITGSPSAKTRGACHRAALCADPVALSPGNDTVEQSTGF